MRGAPLLHMPGLGWVTWTFGCWPCSAVSAWLLDKQTEYRSKKVKNRSDVSRKRLIFKCIESSIMCCLLGKVRKSFFFNGTSWINKSYMKSVYMCLCMGSV